MGFYRAKGWKVLREEMDEEADALKTVMTKALTKENKAVTTPTMPRHPTRQAKER